MNNYDDYMDRIRAAANARKPLTRAEWQVLGVYFGLVAVAAVIALATGHLFTAERREWTRMPMGLHLRGKSLKRACPC